MATTVKAATRCSLLALGRGVIDIADSFVSCP
jgi:hypothetical protein